MTVAELSGVARVEVPACTVSGTGATITAEVKSDTLAAQAGMPLISKVVDVTLNNGTLSGQLTITLYYDKSKLAADQQPVACYYNAGQGQWLRLEGSVDENAGTVAVTVDHLTTFAVFAAAKEVTPPVTFKDMQGHWAAGTVSRLASMGVISGYPDGTFKPDNQITRAEAAAMILRLLDKIGSK